MCSGVEEESGSFACRVLTDSVPALEVALAKKTVLTDRIKKSFCKRAEKRVFSGEGLSDSLAFVEIREKAHCISSGLVFRIA